MAQIRAKEKSLSPLQGIFHLQSFLVIGLVLLSLSAVLLNASQGWILSAYDAQSTLYTARSVHHSLERGIAHLVGSELPLPHLLIVPFVWIDGLYTTGLAGSLISILAYIGASIALFRLALLIWESRFAAWLATLAFALNPNLLYLQSTPMSESLYLCATLWAVYAFVRFLGTERVRHLLISAFFTCLATLTRYEAWILPVVMVGIIGFFAYRKKWTRARWEGTTLVFLSLAGVGIVGWLLCHAAVYGNPINFLIGEYGILESQARLEGEGLLPTKGNFLLSFVSVIYTIATNSGIVLYILFIIGLCLGYPKRGPAGEKEGKAGRLEASQSQGWSAFIPFLLLIIPVLGHLIAVNAGLSTLLVPGLSGVSVPAFFKARYGMLMLPVVALFVGALGRFRHRLIQIALVLIVISQYGWMSATDGIITLTDATQGWSAAPPRKAEQWLAENYDEGLILVDAFALAPRFRDMPMPLSRFITQRTGDYWQESLQDASRHAKFIWMRPKDRVWQAVWGKPTFKANFRQVFKDKQMLIYRRK